MYSQEFTERVKLFKDTAAFRHTKSVPNLSNDYTWKISDSRYSFKEAYFDSKKMEKLVCENHERYLFDAYLDLGTRNHFPQMAALGGGSYVLNEETGGINVTDAPTLQPEEYSEFAKDPMSWLNILFQRKFPEIKTEQFVQATMAFLQASGYEKRIKAKFAEKYNRPTMISTSTSVGAPFETFHSSFRGIAGISLDMRRHKKGLLEASEAYWNAMVKPSVERALKAGEKDYIADLYLGLIAHPVMSYKQYQEFYWPYLKQIIDMAVKEDKLLYFYVESEIKRLADFFRDVPKGNAIMHLELDDIFEMRAELPNMCLAGGMTTDLLGRGTPTECVDYAKKLVNEMGDGFIMSQNKMLSFKNDCKRENLLAVNEYIRSL